MNAVGPSVDSFVEAFERARASGPVADLTRFAPPAGHSLHRAVLRELVRVDLEIGWAEGRPTPLAAYRQAYPELFADPASAADIGFEEFRLRQQAGQQPTVEEYRAAGIEITDWPTLHARDGPEETELPSPESPASPGGSSLRPVTLIPAGGPTPVSDLQTLLHRRLRFVALGAAVILAYFCLLVVLNPAQKVAFSLRHWSLVAFNWVAFLACAAIAAVLWAKPILGLGRLRAAEVALYGTLLGEMGLHFFSDLFLDRELREPFTQGEHALFHYGSSWSLPFFALIVSYGVLVPSTWRRCVVAVSLLALVPLAIAAAAGVTNGHTPGSFVQSFFAQMALWLVAASAIAVFGAGRLEDLRREVVAARRLGQYHLQHRLGAGGMGEVYLARHALLRRPCAVKLVRPELAGDPGALDRFEREVQMTATLTHPNTVQVFDYGRAEDGTFYYVMEYLPGLTLDQAVRRQGPIAPARVVAILRQLCGALAEAHAAGLIHRDLKPGNVILGERGGRPDVAKLLDFGLALERDVARGDRPAGGAVVVAGSPPFMSPEQAAGRAKLDARSDVYSLGAVAYYLLTGQPPFVRDTLANVLAAQIAEPVPPPCRLRPGIPEDLQAVVLRCLAKDPAERYPDAASLDRALAACEAAGGGISRG